MACCAETSAGLIANDRRANALQIYLSKPLMRMEYIGGKLGILVGGGVLKAGAAPQITAHLAGYILEAGRALVVAINKWDGQSTYQRDQTKLAAEKALGELTAKGMQFNEIAPAEYARMQDGDDYLAGTAKPARALLSAATAAVDRPTTLAVVSARMIP